MVCESPPRMRERLNMLLYFSLLLPVKPADRPAIPAARVNPMPANGTCRITFVAAVIAQMAEIMPNTLVLLIIVWKDWG